MDEVRDLRRHVAHARRHHRRGVGRHRGGILSLLGLIAEHGEAIEVDLRRYYQLDLYADIGTGRLSWRRLRVLISHLPRDAATVIAIHGPPPAWGAIEHLVATVVDEIRLLSWLTRSAHFKGRPRQPNPLRRPGVDTPGERVLGRGRGMSKEAMRARLARVRKGR